MADSVSSCESCKKSEYADKVTLKRCGKCKNVFYWCAPAGLAGACDS